MLRLKTSSWSSPLPCITFFCPLPPQLCGGYFFRVLTISRHPHGGGIEGKVAAESQPWKSSRLFQLRGLQQSQEQGGGATEQFSSEKGEPKADVRTGTPVRVVTPLITASVRGTSFTMRAASDGSSFLNVDDGAVDAMNRAGEKLLVSQGMDFNFTTPQFNQVLQNAGILQQGQSWQNLPAESINTYTESQAALTPDNSASGRTSPPGTDAAPSGSSPSGGASQSDSPGASANASGDSAAAAGLDRGTGAEAGSLDAILSNPNADPMAGDDHLDMAAAGQIVTAGFVGYEAFQVRTAAATIHQDMNNININDV